MTITLSPELAALIKEKVAAAAIATASAPLPVRGGIVADLTQTKP